MKNFLFCLFVLQANFIYAKKPVQVTYRQIAIIVSDTGFYPSKLAVFAGESINFFVTSIASSPQCFSVAGLDLFVSAKKNQIIEANMTFPHSGTFEFGCPSHSSKGKIVVLSNGRAGRMPASESGSREWWPRDDKQKP